MYFNLNDSFHVAERFMFTVHCSSTGLSFQDEPTVSLFFSIVLFKSHVGDGVVIQMPLCSWCVESDFSTKRNER